MMLAALSTSVLFLVVGGFEPLLFMDLNDVEDPYGLVEEVANTVEANNLSLSPPPLPFSLGAQVFAVIESENLPGTFEVYADNTTGWEPILGEVGGYHDCTLLRFTTTDFKVYSKAQVVLTIDSCSGTPTMKSIARSNGGLYVMFSVGGPPPGLGTYTSNDQGMSWTKGNTTGVLPPDKDDLNIIFEENVREPPSPPSMPWDKASHQCPLGTTLRCPVCADMRNSDDVCTH